MTEPSRLRKRPLEADAATIARAADEFDIAGCATIAYSSEDPAHPVEDLFDGRSGPGTTRWMSARPDTLEHIVENLIVSKRFEEQRVADLLEWAKEQKASWLAAELGYDFSNLRKVLSGKIRPKRLLARMFDLRQRMCMPGLTPRARTVV
jgi:hypothetical protein